MLNKKMSLISMPPHSKAKVELYSNYLSIYLNILSRANFINDIYLYDLFAGEGIYADGGLGSPIVTMQKIEEHYKQNNSCPNIYIRFNDNGESNIEPGKMKIDRIKEQILTMFEPKNVKVSFTTCDYNEILPDIISKLQNIDNSGRALLFIDPCGYKDIKPRDLYELLENGKTEIILFLPINFMYRFVGKSQDDSFAGGIPLREFTNELFNNQIPDFTSEPGLINALKERFRAYLPIEYADTFTIEKGKNRYFCLFFFTNNKLGFHRMLESKWKIDEASGRGWSISQETQDMFGERIWDYENPLLEFIKINSPSNMALYDFGLKNGFLPKHTKVILKKYKENIQKKALDLGSTKGYYIGNKSRNVIFIWGE